VLLQFFAKRIVQLLVEVVRELGEQGFAADRSGLIAAGLFVAGLIADELFAGSYARSNRRSCGARFEALSSRKRKTKPLN